ncbi:MAG: hypothetical protein ACQXXL_00725 [Candidatus Methanosuratincola sp.]
MAILMFASSMPVQPLSGGQSYVTFYSGDQVLLAPEGGTYGRGTGMAYSISEIPQPQGWIEPFTSPPQGVPVAQWAAANGYAFEGTAPASSALSLNVTNGALTWTNNDAARTRAAYNFTLWKSLDQPLYAYDLAINIYVAKGSYRTGAAPLYLTITAYDQNMVPIVTLRFNTSGTQLYGNASAYGGSPVALESFYNTVSTFTVSSGGYGAQATLSQNASQKLTFASFTPIRHLSINYFINEAAFAQYDKAYTVKIEDASASPAPEPPALFGVPAGEWWYTASNGETIAWEIPAGGAGALSLEGLPTAFNGEFSAATTGAWVPQGLSTFAVSGGSLNTKGGGIEITNNGLGQPAAGFPGAYYALPARGEGDFYIAVRVALSFADYRLQYASRIGIAITDTAGNIIAYLTASFYHAKMTSPYAMNLQDCYFGISPNNAEGGTKLRPGGSLTVNISRTGSTWRIVCGETETDCTATGTTASIGGVLLHHTNTVNDMNAGWDYVRTNLSAEIGLLSGNAVQRAASGGTFFANTTLTYTATNSGMPLLVSTTREDSDGLKFAGVSEGDLVAIFGSDGSPAYSTTVPAGATGITVTGVQLPFAGTAMVTRRPNARPIAQHSGALSVGDTLALACDDQGGCSLLKISTGGGFPGVLVTGLQHGWKVVVTSGGSDSVLYAGHTGEALVSLPTEIDAISVFKPTVEVHSTLQEGTSYALERMLKAPGFTATDTIFYEVSTTAYRYRVEVRLLSVERQSSGAIGSLDKMTFTFRIYEDGVLAQEVAPVATIGENGTAIPVSKTAPYTFAALIPAPAGSQSSVVKFRDPASGIVVEGRLIFEH